MTNHIENNLLSVQVKSLGAELHSLKTKADSAEHLWQGDADVWAGQSPILFPIVGRLLHDTYHIDGKPYSLPKHGFARTRRFTPAEQTRDRLVYSLCSDNQTRAVYPYDFELQVSFALDGYTLHVNHSVINNGSDDMLFSIGAHPAFICELGDFIEFEHDETVFREYLDGSGIIIPEKQLILDNNREIEITKDLFDRDALLLSGLKSEYVSLRKRSGRDIKVFFGSAPFLGIWAKPRAKYVCIEPWHGINDSYTHNQGFAQKRGIGRLGKAERFDFPFSITVE